MTKTADPTETAAAPRDVLDTAIDAARIASPLLETQGFRQHVFVPDGYELQDVTDPNTLPPHITQRVTVDVRNSLVDYSNRFSGPNSVIVANYEQGTIATHLDWHKDNQNDLTPSANKHSVTLHLRDSEEYRRWNMMEGGMHSQEDFALFIEENVADVMHPDHSDLLEICRELEATQGTSFRSGVRLDNGDRSFTYETETKTKGDMAVPTEITLSIPLYMGETPVETRAKFRFKPTSEGLQLGFRWHRVEYQRMAMFEQMAHSAAEETGLPVFFGRT